MTVIADPPLAARAAVEVPPTPARLPIRGRAIRTRWFSVRLDPRAIGVCVVLAIVIVVVGCWSISVGDFPIPMSDVIATLLGHPTADSEFIVGTLRLPRVLVAVGVGAAFGMSGAIFQALVRNPLGSPDIIGFNAGAALGAVVMIVYVGGSSTQIAMGAVAGGFIAAVLVYLLAWKHGVKAYRLVLVGIGAGFAIEALIDFLITRARITDVQRAAVWLTGSLNGRSWEHVRVVWLALLVLGPLAIVMQRSLDRLELGDDMAAALGLRVSRSKLALVCVGVALAALGVAAAGPIAFVAFVAGPDRPSPRALTGRVHRARRVRRRTGRRRRRPRRTSRDGTDRTARRDHDRGDRRAVPALAAHAPGPNRSIVSTVNLRETSGETGGDRLRVEGVRLSYDDRTIIDGLSLSVPDGKITVIVGPNACGKSTLLRALARLLRPSSGHVILDGEQIHRLPTKEVARRLGLLPQTPIAPEGILVVDLVARGRTPHQKLFQQWSEADERAVRTALEATSSMELADRPVDELSGGQRQRVWIALTLAQETDLLLLDEPTTFLDIAHQIDVLDLVEN